METWIPQDWHELILDRIMAANYQSVCTQRPGTFYNAYWPEVTWAMSTPYQQGDLVRPPSVGTCIYECIQAGTSGNSEPGWGTSQDQEFNDGSVRWKSHRNYSLVVSPMLPADFTKSIITDGANLLVAQKSGLLIHRTGLAAHAALLNTNTKELLHSTKALSTQGTALESGNLTVFHAYNIRHVAQQ